MKKIIPAIMLVGASCLFTGCNAKVDFKDSKIKTNIDSFKESLNLYSSINENKANKMVFNKYLLEIDDNLSDSTNLDANIDDNQTPSLLDTEAQPEENDSNTNLETASDETNSNDSQVDTQTTADSQQISTLYSLTSDINDSCDEFCTLKTELTDAILETENLLNKLRNKEVELSREEKLLIEEQSVQLKNLASKLKTITTELNFELSELNEVISDADYDTMNLKYLLILNNLMDGNEMLEHGLESMRRMNYLFNQNDGTIPPNNYGRMFYGFKRNDEPAVIKNYYIDENGEPNEITDDESTEVNQDNTQTTSGGKFQSNVDTYRNTNQNIDTFFNTALMDNEFMYGNRGYGYGPANYGGYGYTGINQQENRNLDEPETNNKSKRFNINKNVDTYRDANTPTLKAKISNMKNGVKNFFKKFNKTDIDDKAVNPVYRFDKENENEKGNN